MNLLYGWDLHHLPARLEIDLCRHTNQIECFECWTGGLIMNTSLLGIDIVKNVFQLHGVDTV